MSMDGAMIAHEWAHGRDRKYARNNVFAESGTIYSYGRHFPMSRFYTLPGKDAGRVVLYTSRGYSVSTARHLSYVRAAVRGQRVFTVYKVCNSCGGDLSKREHKENLRVMLEECAALVAKSKNPRLRESTRSGFIARSEELRKAANEYRRAFKLGGRDVASVGVAAERIVKAERAAALKAKKEAARRKAESEERFARWCAGAEDVRGIFSDFPVTFRLKPGTKGRIVETSLGAEFASAAARAAWPALVKLRGELMGAKVGAIADLPRGQIEIGRFSVNRVTLSGFVVGCHNVAWEAAENLARLLWVSV